MARVPLAYAAILGLVLNLGNVTIPEPLLKAIHLLGQASIPTMLTVLGLQLAETFRSKQRALPLPALATVIAMRLLLAPAIAWAAAWAVGLGALTRNVVVLESAMPTAVLTTILAAEFESDPAFASLCVMSTTLASLPTVTILLNWLT
jgi:predicted permease